ncbi:hypothetical protein M9Y10_000892 [Tritrichomonas musculus]|uniref:Importin N-terminal domain-containing protein n=1 Tax=Tritrichomonas musculus TaxID=1915356 RepID=A0ABR2L5H0_9EUKA
MKNLLDELSQISKQKIVLDPDVIISSKLVDFEKLLPEQSKLSDDNFEIIESVLIQALYANNSQISFQCSIRIAQCLLLLYQGERQMKIWNLVTSFNKNPTIPITYATGHVLNKRGKYSKSVISGVAKTLLSLNEKNVFPQLFALHACFKSSPKDMAPFVEKTLSIIKKFLLIPNEPVQLQCLKLSIKLVKNRQMPNDKILPLISQLLQDQIMPYIIDESCYLIAIIALSQLKSMGKTTISESSDQDEWSEKTKKGSNSEISRAFTIIESFKKHFSSVFPRFLSLLNPEFINRNSMDLLTFARRIDPHELPLLISFFGIDVRKELFEKISQENVSVDQLSILAYLAFDSKSLSDAASLAIEIATRPKSKDKSKSSKFFADFVKKDPETASKYLRKAAKFLANPPQESDTLEDDLRGLSVIVATVLTAAADRDQLIELVEDNCVTFLADAMKSDSITSPKFIPAFTVMTALPERFIDKEGVDKLLSLFPAYLKNFQYQSNLDKEKRIALHCSESLTLFFTVHCGFRNVETIIDLITTNDYLYNEFNQLCIFLAYPKLLMNPVGLAKLATKLKSIVMRAKAKQEFISAIVKDPFRTRTMFLNHIEFEMGDTPDYFTSSNSKEIMYRMYKIFPDFISALPESIQHMWVKWLVVECARNTAVHCLILALINDRRTQKLLPVNLHEVMLSVISSLDGTSNIQIAAEIIACWVRLFPKILNKVLSDLSHKKDCAQCLTLAAIYSYVPMTDDMITNQIIELNNIAKTNSDLCPFAMFALSSLFLSYSGQLAAMPFTDTQANFLLSLLCTSISLDPFVLYHISRAFNSLLPIISPDIESSRPMAIPIVKMMIQLIAGNPLPFCRQIFFHMMHSVFSFIRQYSDIAKMNFPVSKGVNLSCKIEACRAFADMLVIKNNDYDFMDLIPQILLILQLTNHNNALMFVIAVAANFASTNDPTSPSTRGQIQKWTQLAKLCISSGNLPSTGNVKIAANDKVKICMLKVISEILPMLIKTEPLLGEALDDIVTSLTRAVESRVSLLQKLAYPQLYKVIIDFGEIKGEADQPIISLYDIMFASAVKVGFYNLDISGDFVLSFLTFHISNMNNLYEEFISILDYFFVGFKECNHKTWHYHAITAKLCKVSMSKNDVYEKIKGFLSSFMNDYSKIILKAGYIWNEDPPNAIEISLFKTQYQSFYSDLIESFIWIQSFYEENDKIIIPKQLLTFFLEELSFEDNELWRINGAFCGLACLLEYESSHIKNKMLAKVIRAASYSYNKWNYVIRPYLPKFMKSASEMIEPKNAEEWDDMVQILIDDNFDPIVLCYLIKNGEPETISQYSINFVELIFKCYKEEKVDLEKSIALCTMIFYIADDQLLDLLDFVLKRKGRKSHIIDFKFAYLSQIFKFLPKKKKVANEFGSKLSQFIWNNFTNGGQKLMVQLICDSKIMAKYVLLSDEANDYTISIVEDLNLILSYFDFARFVFLNFDYLHDNNDFVTDLIKFCFRIIIQWNDDKKGTNVILQSGQILKMISSDSSPLIRIAFKEMDYDFQQIVINAVKKFTTIQKSRSKGANLQLFSKSSSRSKLRRSGRKSGEDDFDNDDDWQDLTIED